MTIAMRAQIRQWADRIDALELRERILLLAATVAVLFLLVDALALKPILKAQQVTEQRIAEIEIKLTALHQQANLLNFKNGDDALASRYAKRDRLAGQLAELDTRILDQMGALVEPAQAAQVLEQVLSSHRGLKLKSLKASADSLRNLELENPDSGGGLGRYQLEMVVEGRYLELLRYLQDLEAMPWKFFWESADLRTVEYPRAETRLQLYTLGAQSG